MLFIQTRRTSRTTQSSGLQANEKIYLSHGLTLSKTAHIYGRSVLLLVLLAATLTLTSCADEPETAREADECANQFLSDVCIIGQSGSKTVFGSDVTDANSPVLDTQTTVSNDVQASVPDTQNTVSDAGMEDVSTPEDAVNATPCTSHFDCGGKAACIDGVCKVECNEDKDCGPEDQWSCKQFQCMSTVDTAIADTAQPTTDDTNTPPEDTEPPTTPDTNKPAEDVNPNCTDKKAPYGTTCYCKGDCITGLCLGDIAAGKGFCTDECFTSDSCPGTDWCYQDPSGTKVCVKNDAGASCANGCLSGITLSSKQGECICTTPCSSAGECPGTMACSAVPLGGVPTKVCVPIGDFCDPQNPINCFGFCFPNLMNTWLCTAACNSFNDCPTGYTCHQEVLEGQVYQTCLPK